MTNKIVNQIASAAAQIPATLRRAQAEQSRSGLKKRYLLAHQRVRKGLEVETTRPAHAKRLATEYALVGALAGRTLGAYAITGLLDHLVGTTGYSGHAYVGFLGDENSGLPKLAEQAASFVGWHLGYAAATAMTLRSSALRGTDTGKTSLALAKRQVIALTAADLLRQGVRPVLFMPVYALQASVLLTKLGFAVVGAAVGTTLGLPFLIQALCVDSKMRTTSIPFAQQMLTAVFGPDSFSATSIDDFDPHLTSSDKSPAQNYTRYLIKRTGWQAGDKLALALDAAEGLVYGASDGIAQTEMRVVRRRVIRMMGVKATSSIVEPCILGTYGLFNLITQGAGLIGSLTGTLIWPQAPQREMLNDTVMPGAYPV